MEINDNDEIFRTRKFRGRPSSDAGRPEAEIAVYDFLDKAGVEYVTLTHRPAFTMEECEAVRREAGAPVFKNLFLTNRQQTDFYLLLMPGDKPFKTKILSKQIGSARLSFGSAEHMEKYLDITPGSVSVLGLMNDAENHVKLLIDADLLKDEFIGCHPCINTSTLRFKMSDMTGKLLPAVRHEMTVVELPWEVE